MINPTVRRHSPCANPSVIMAVLDGGASPPNITPPTPLSLRGESNDPLLELEGAGGVTGEEGRGYFGVIVS
jgi:hypothetical protein